MKANATIAAELKKLGFRRGIESWRKSQFEKRIWNDDRGVVIITAEIRNDRWTDEGCVSNNWVIRDEVRLVTQQHDDGFKVLHGSIKMNGEMAKDIADTLNALEGMKR